MTEIARSLRRSRGVLFLGTAFLSLVAACGGEELSLKPPYLAASTDVIDFGEVMLGVEEEQTLYVINKGDKVLTLEPPTGNTLGGVFAVLVDSTEVSPMADAVARVVFQPTAVASYETTLSILNDSLNEPGFAVTLRGIGVRGDLCAGVACQTPPSACFGATGQCHDGACIYTALSGVTCNDDDPCSLDDRCQDGTCRGTPRRCDAPPAPSCRDAHALVVYDAQGVCINGMCQYLPRDVNCPYGCVSGACQGDPCAGGCDDGNPCTRDRCQLGVGCRHDPDDGASCAAPSGDCPVGRCVGTTCMSVAGTTCVAEVDLDLCADTEIAGICAANGECAVQEVPPQLTCPGCPGICVQCYFVQLCLPL